MPDHALTGNFKHIDDAPEDVECSDFQIANKSPVMVAIEDAPLDAEGVYHLEGYVDPEEYNLSKPTRKGSKVIMENEKEDDATVARAIATQLASDYDFRNDDTGLYVFNEATGTYELLQKSGDYFGSIAYFVMNSTSNQNKFKSSIFNMVYSWLRNNRKLSKPMPMVPENKVCLRNVVYDLMEGTVSRHNKRYGFKHSVDAYYEVRPQLNSVSRQFFERLGGSEERARLILAALGIIISNYRKLNKSIFLYGARCNGKSTLAEFIRKVLPEKSVRGLSMGDFGNQFAIANLKDAHVNICTDLPVGNWTKAAIGKFKQVVTGDFFEAGPKGVQQDTIKPRVFTIFIANFLPTIPASQDPEGAVQRRIWPIQTGNTIPADEVDPDILEKLLSDVDSIISVALQEASTLLRSTELARITSVGDEIYEKRPALLEDCLKEFVEDDLLFTGFDSDTVPLSKAFEVFVLRYQDDCNEVKTLQKNGFGMRIRKAIYGAGGYVKKLRNVSTLIGFKLKEETDDNSKG